VDEANGREKRVMSVPSVTTDAADTDTAAAVATGGHGGRYCYSSHHEASSHDKNTASWTSAEVMLWLQRSRLQHLDYWYV